MVHGQALGLICRKKPQTVQKNPLWQGWEHEK
jgi:hypothetical protein